MIRREKFVKILQEKTSGLEVKFKNKSNLMKLLGFILFFNSKFMTDYVTTIGKTIYFPTETDFLAETETSSIMTLAHEYQHVKDYEKTPIWFIWSYLFPLSALPLLLLSFVFLPWYIAIFSLLSLAPLPAYWRMRWELRGYTMSLFMFHAIAKERDMESQRLRETLQSLVEHYNKQFTGWAYYVMWPFGVKKKLLLAVEKIISGTLAKEDVIFRDVINALEKSRV